MCDGGADLQAPFTMCNGGYSGFPSVSSRRRGWLRGVDLGWDPILSSLIQLSPLSISKLASNLLKLLRIPLIMFLGCQTYRCSLWYVSIDSES